jgi:hypothetical protein
MGGGGITPRVRLEWAGVAPQGMGAARSAAARWLLRVWLLRVRLVAAAALYGLQQTLRHASVQNGVRPTRWPLDAAVRWACRLSEDSFWRTEIHFWW